MTTAFPVPLTRSDIEIATRAADNFTRLYYSTYDSKTRLADLPHLYRESSTMVWNGKAFQGEEAVTQLIQKMPPTIHEMQSYDCHPIPGTSPPSLLISVSGRVTHGRGPSGNQTTGKTVEGYPRAFHQTFMLVPDSAAAPTKVGEVGKYFISADCLRFVG